MSPLHLARRLWRAAVPEALRRRAAPSLNQLLKAYVRASARAPHGAEISEGPIKVVGYFSGSHGIAASARLAGRALEALGVPVERVDAGGATLTWAPVRGPTEQASAWIFHLNPPELLAELAVLGPRRLIGPRYGYWAFELPRAPSDWLKDAVLVDEVWAPSHYTAEAFTGAAAPVRVVPHPLFIEDYRQVIPAVRTTSFQAVALFDFNSSAARKNPQGAIEAFRRAFGEDPNCELVIKTQNGRLFPELAGQLRAGAPPNVRFVDETWPYEKVKSLIAGADVLISLHRAEGFGLTPAEAMALGTPVIATAFSGVLDFMDEDCALMIPYQRAEVADVQGIYRGQSWAEPDLAAAAEALRRLRAAPRLGHDLARRAQDQIGQRLSPQAWFACLPANVQAAALRLKARDQRELARS